jgi:acetylornithine/succinyldiaminopimelate/putrescine aminotransferase
MGLQTSKPMGGVQLSVALYRHGVWAMFAGFDLSVLQFKPGLLVDEAYCDELLRRLDAALRDVESEGG